MSINSEKHIFNSFQTVWPVPTDVSDFNSYGLWNSLCSYDQKGRLVRIIPAHDGDFFPESPLDHVEALRSAILSCQDGDATFWPVRVDIDITQRCTGDCYFCYARRYAFDSEYRDAEIALTSVEEILQELTRGGTKSVRLTGGGEPLMHPQIRSILPLLKRCGLRSCVITNGVLLDSEMRELLVSCVDHIRISLNAAQDNTRQHLHRTLIGPNNLTKIFGHMRWMVQRRKTTHPREKRPLIWATFILLPENIDEIRLAAQLAKDSGIDSISFRPMYHMLARPFSGQELQTLQRQLRLALTLHSPPDFQVFTPKRELATVWQMAPSRQFPRCISCHLRTIMEATNQGPKVKICGLHRGTEGECIGVLRGDTRFSDLWNSRKTHALLSNGARVCERCIDISMNVTLNEVWSILRKHPQAVFQKSWCRTFCTEAEKDEK